MFSYSRSKGTPIAHLQYPLIFKWANVRDWIGLFAGLTLDGTILVERKDANHEFYGSTISSTDILT